MDDLPSNHPLQRIRIGQVTTKAGISPHPADLIHSKRRQSINGPVGLSRVTHATRARSQGPRLYDTDEEDIVASLSKKRANAGGQRKRKMIGPRRPRGRPRKKPKPDDRPKRPVGRPRTNPINRPKRRVGRPRKHPVIQHPQPQLQGSAGVANDDNKHDGPHKSDDDDNAGERNEAEDDDDEVEEAEEGDDDDAKDEKRQRHEEVIERFRYYLGVIGEDLDVDEEEVIREDCFLCKVPPSEINTSGGPMQSFWKAIAQYHKRPTEHNVGAIVREFQVASVTIPSLREEPEVTRRSVMLHYMYHQRDDALQLNHNKVHISKALEIVGKRICDPEDCENFRANISLLTLLSRTFVQML